MVRNSLNYVSWKMRAEVAADLKSIYTSATADEAEQRLGEFEAKWDDAYLPISQSWRRNWSRIILFFDYPPEIRKVIYATNAIESVNMGLRKITKNRGSFPSEDALEHQTPLQAMKKWQKEKPELFVKRVSNRPGLDSYFSDPCSSWQHGSNENTNGLIGKYFPKKTDFTTLSDKEIAEVERKWRIQRVSATDSNREGVGEMG